MPANYVLLSEVTVGEAGAASVTFSNIPQTGYTDLKVTYSARSTAAAARIDVRWYFNSDTSGSNYSYRRLFGYEGGALSGSGSGTYTDAGTAITGSTATSNTFSNNELYIPNYTGSTAKSASGDWTAENNSGSNYILGINAHLWNQTAAISSITFSPASGNFAANSTFYLYGLAAVGTTPVIAPFATGGDIITNDGTYWYHAFLSSGTFTPQKALTADCLVVAGGGGSGRIVAGGAGAGGLIKFTGQSLTSGVAQTITIGAGGAGRIVSGYGAGTNGSDSQLGSLTLVKGGGTSAFQLAGSTGGSGGGGSYDGTGGLAGGSGTAGQGNAGGSGAVTGGSTAGMGGGGGAGAVGTNATPSKGGNGGIGFYDSFTNAIGAATSLGQLSGGNYYFAGGGGGSANGASYTSANRGDGGLGGGGYGGFTNTSTSSDTGGIAGTANTGGGGGGAPNDYTGNNSNTQGKNGGSGIVIIRYPIA